MVFVISHLFLGILILAMRKNNATFLPMKFGSLEILRILTSTLHYIRKECEGGGRCLCDIKISLLNFSSCIPTIAAFISMLSFLRRKTNAFHDYSTVSDNKYR